MKNKITEEVPELSTVSSKGQLVIPHELREKLNIEQGCVFAITNPIDDLLILKKIDNKLTQEEIELLEDVRDAWESIAKGECTISDEESFLEEIEKW